MYVDIFVYVYIYIYIYINLLYTYMRNTRVYACIYIYVFISIFIRISSYIEILFALPMFLPCHPVCPRSGFTGVAGCADVNSVGETQTALLRRLLRGYGHLNLVVTTVLFSMGLYIL